VKLANIIMLKVFSPVRQERRRHFTAALTRSKLSRAWIAALFIAGCAATAGCTTRVRPKDLMVWRASDEDFTTVEFSPDGSMILTKCYSAGFCFWDAETGDPIRQYYPPVAMGDSQGRVVGPVFDPSGHMIIVPGIDEAVVIETKSGDTLLELPVPGESVYSAAFSPDASWIATADSGQQVRIWDAASGEELRHWRAGECSDDWRCWLAAFISHDGTLIVTTGADHGVRLWDAQTGELVRELFGHTSVVSHADFSSDDSRIVTASWDHTLIIWETATGEVLHVIPDMGWAMDAEFSPDDSLVVGINWRGAGAIKLFDAETGELVFDYPGYTDFKYALDFHPSGNWFAVVGGESYVGGGELVLYSIPDR
jgi:WD40 repeat protein